MDKSGTSIAKAASLPQGIWWQRHDQLVFLVTLALLVYLPWAILFGHRGLAVILMIPGIAFLTQPKLWLTVKSINIAKLDFKSPQLIVCFLFIGFCFWIWLSAFWSPIEERHNLAFRVFFPVFMAGLWIWTLGQWSVERLKYLQCVFVAGVALSLALLTFELLTDGFLRNIVPPKDQSWLRHKDMIALARGAGAMIFLMVPTILLSRHNFKNWWLAVVMVVLAFVTNGGFSIAANMLALGGGLCAGLVAWYAPVWGRRMLGFGLIFAILAAPLLAIFLSPEMIHSGWAEGLPVSWRQRIVTWAALGDHLAGGLPFGYGADYVRFLARSGVEVEIPGAFASLPLPVYPLHPHNIFLQIWVELGIPGVIFVLALIFAFIRLLAKYRADGLAAAGPVNASMPLIYPAFIALATMVFINGFVEASLWQVWRLSNIALAVIGLTLCSHLMVRLPMDKA